MENDRDVCKAALDAAAKWIEELERENAELAKDKGLLDWIEAWTKGEITVCPPGHHGGHSAKWLVSLDDYDKGDSFGPWCIEGEAPTLRDAIDAAREASR